MLRINDIICQFVTIKSVTPIEMNEIPFNFKSSFVYLFISTTFWDKYLMKYVINHITYDKIEYLYSSN